MVWAAPNLIVDGNTGFAADINQYAALIAETAAARLAGAGHAGSIAYGKGSATTPLSILALPSGLTLPMLSVAGAALTWVEAPVPGGGGTVVSANPGGGGTTLATIRIGGVNYVIPSGGANLGALLTAMNGLALPGVGDYVIRRTISGIELAIAATPGTGGITRIYATDPLSGTGLSGDPIVLGNLLASRITGGVFDVGRIPSLPTVQITNGVFDLARIPNLPANRITSGILDGGLIPSLPTVQITASSTTPVSLPTFPVMPNAWPPLLTWGSPLMRTAMFSCALMAQVRTRFT